MTTVTVRITPRGYPSRQLIFGGVTHMHTDARDMVFEVNDGDSPSGEAEGWRMPIVQIAALELDDDAQDP